MIDFDRREKRVIILFLYTFMESPGDIRDFWLDKSPGTVPCYETIKYWVRRFRSENYDLEDRLRSGRPSHLIADDFGDIIRGDTGRVATNDHHGVSRAVRLFGDNNQNSHGGTAWLQDASVSLGPARTHH